jgi:glycosyltransferase involved in cell wall biosynthesis
MVRCIALPARSVSELARRLAWQAVRLPRLVRRERCDALISMSGMLPRSPKCRLICLLFNPVMYERRSALDGLRRWGVRSTADHAAHLVAPSRFMAKLVADDTGGDCDVLALGLDHDVFRPRRTSGADLLCVADFYVHKRHDLILDMWLCLPSPRPRLHLVGDPAVDVRAYQRVRERVNRLPEADLVTLEHGLSVEALVAAYQCARVFVLPSERESFCLPLAESMACGVPPIVRGLPSMRETGGSGARYVDGDDSSVWAAAIRQLLEDDDAHDVARAAAMREARRFSWSVFVEGVAARV